jgi:two-component system, LytTR family, sensor kinase
LLGDGNFLTIFRVMKRIVYQIIFWIFYWAINVYLDFYWVRDNIKGWSSNAILFKTSVGALLYILPLVTLAYYLIFIAFEKIIQKRNSFAVNAIMIFIPYAIAICSSIIIVRLVVFPFIYENAFKPGNLFFEPRRFISIMIEAAFPAGLLMSLKYVDTLLSSKELEKDLVKEKLSAELQLLKNQLNPHFLFNTLNNIYALTRKKSDKAPEVVMKLSGLLSFMLYESDKGTISIEREIKFLEDYISLEKIRYTDELSIIFNKNIDDGLQPITPLLLLPLVENAFKHGAGENHFDSFIHINLTLKKQQILFTVENSFEEPEQNTRSNNIGLYNTARQLELIYSEQKLVTGKEHNIFKVQLEINLNSYGKI